MPAPPNRPDPRRQRPISGESLPEGEPVSSDGATVRRPPSQPVAPSARDRTLRSPAFGTPALSRGSSRPTHRPPPPEIAAAPPTARLGKYVRAEKLGSGAMGEVWKAWDTELGRWVALKFLKGGDDGEIARFQREAQVAAGLTHPNIATVYDVGEAAGRHYIAMQFVPGKTLTAARKKGARLAAMLVRDAARGVGHAHANGVIHRDIKPHNVMVTGLNFALGAKKPYDAVFVMDFGLARSTEGASGLSVTGSVIGTPGYMPPEQAKGRPTGPPADVFSLGATLYDLLTGDEPFRGDSLFEVLRAIQEDEPVPPRRADPKIPADLETIVLKALEKDPARRYPDADAFADDLDRFLEGEAVSARRAGVGYRASKAVAKRKPVVAVAAAGVVGIAIVAGVFLSKLGDSGRDKEKALAAQRAKEEKLRADKDREIAAQKDAERRREEARQRALTFVESGRRALEDLRFRKASPSHTQPELHDMAVKAEAEFRKALDAAPDMPEAWLGIGRGWAMAHNRERAAPAIEKAIAAAPQFASAYLDRVRLTFDDYEEMRHDRAGGGAAEETDASRKLRASIEGDLRKAEAATKDLAEKALAEGLLAFADGKFTAAAEKLAGYLKSAPTDGDAHYWRGHALLHVELYKDAGDALTRALECDFRHGSARANRGRVRELLGDLDGAEVDYLEVARQHSDQAGGYLGLAAVARARGDVKRCREMAEAALQREPGNRIAQDFLTWAKQQTGELAGSSVTGGPEAPADVEALLADAQRAHAAGDAKKCVELCDRALAKSPGNADAHRIRGAGRHSAGNVKGALEDAEAALRIRPDYPEALYNRALAKGELGDAKGALADYTACLKLQPGNCDALTNRGLLKSEQGDVDGAIADYSEALRQRPSYIAALVNRAEAYAAKGEKAAAIADFRKSLEVAPRGWDLADPVRRRIAELEK
ncbi:MAG: protein kinase [Planctomycetia bacterium]|nr:protein kinase [Planctomycetia bacterium]